MLGALPGSFGPCYSGGLETPILREMKTEWSPELMYVIVTIMWNGIRKPGLSKNI